MQNTMHRSRRSLLVLVVAILSLALANSAVAQALRCDPAASRRDNTDGPPPVRGPDSTPSIPIYRIGFGSRVPKQMFELRTESGTLLDRCLGTCTLDLPPGGYVARLFNSTGSDSSDLSLRVEGPGTIELTEPNRTVRTIGVVVAVAGGLSLISGSLLTLYSLCGEDCSDGDHRRFAAGAVAMLGGMIVLPVGVLTGIFGGRGSADQTTDTAVAIAPRGDGATCALTGRF